MARFVYKIKLSKKVKRQWRKLIKSCPSKLMGELFLFFAFYLGIGKKIANY
ncbi:MAG: hypothetical protein U9R03_00760 [Candidatus Aerophobetes bacterium]|nr:hypothetical protein [Candidatus Aerophobetes bacterium]